MASTTVFAIFIIFSAVIVFDPVDALYEDVRCKCICPSPAVVKGNNTERKLYIANVPPMKCTCEGVVIPQADEYVKDKDAEFCPRCECRYEKRNTKIIFVVVIIIIWVISLLTVYMLFLMCLEPLLNKRRTAYQEHTNEEVTLDEPMPAIPRSRIGSGNVLNRVGQQQDRWKKRVQEQRRNIYDRHTMLN